MSLYEHKQWDMVIGGLRFPEGNRRAFRDAGLRRSRRRQHLVDAGRRFASYDRGGGRPNGSAFVRTNEHLIVTDAGRNAILSIDLAAGTTEVLDAKGLRGPNDLLVEDEAVTFTDPGKSSLRNRIGRVLRLEHGELQVLAEGLAIPNGIARHVDGRLFVAETRTNFDSSTWHGVRVD